jgi:hypothetical protein
MPKLADNFINFIPSRVTVGFLLELLACRKSRLSGTQCHNEICFQDNLLFLRFISFSSGG